MNERSAAGARHRGRYYWDEQGMPRADFDPPHEVVGSFLEQDVQSVSRCEELIAIVDETKVATRSRYDSGGNAHNIVIDQGGVCIENDYAEPRRAAALSLDEFRGALLDWKLLTTRSRLDR